MKPVLITGGHTITCERGVTSVPKKELVSVLQALIQSRTLRIATVPDRELLVKELLDFKVKFRVAGNESFEAWRPKSHDDLVLSAALAAFWAVRSSKLKPGFEPYRHGTGAFYPGLKGARVRPHEYPGNGFRLVPDSGPY